MELINKNELSQLYYLNRDIEQLKNKIEALEHIVNYAAVEKKYMTLSNTIDKYKQKIEELKDLLNINMYKCFYELKKINRYIESIDDIQMRMIIKLRYINGLNWKQIAASISPHTSGEAVKKAHERFLNKK
ncbi:hypothetical protein [Clostridium tyrobutyricum]|uniref:hypothetical protein n=1 Tax=Clostridium tyrobutyricum TaxID=1519 RepID=UPI001C388FAF|nr:hypothetical protein [Clostridium tyrobutyricum]MBV4425274.1 hypothetical protein [Clostridium tyrobutyricum]